MRCFRKKYASQAFLKRGYSASPKGVTASRAVAGPPERRLGSHRERLAVLVLLVVALGLALPFALGLAISGTLAYVAESVGLRVMEIDGGAVA